MLTSIAMYNKAFDAKFIEHKLAGVVVFIPKAVSVEEVISAYEDKKSNFPRTDGHPAGAMGVVLVDAPRMIIYSGANGAIGLRAGGQMVVFGKYSGLYPQSEGRFCSDASMLLARPDIFTRDLDAACHLAVQHEVKQVVTKSHLEQALDNLRAHTKQVRTGLGEQLVEQARSMSDSDIVRVVQCCTATAHELKELTDIYGALSTLNIHKKVQHTPVRTTNWFRETSDMDTFVSSLQARYNHLLTIKDAPIEGYRQPYAYIAEYLFSLGLDINIPNPDKRYVVDNVLNQGAEYLRDLLKS